VKVSQYNVSDYFTKLTAGLSPASSTPFMGQRDYLQSYASQGQLLTLDEPHQGTTVDLSQYSIGTAAWNYTTASSTLPMDWATAAIYYNEADLQAAGTSPRTSTT